MTPDEIKAHPVFAKLTEPRQKFVVALIENKNDKVAAAYVAWKPKERRLGAFDGECGAGSSKRRVSR
jgi:hypothetical protein